MLGSGRSILASIIPFQHFSGWFWYKIFCLGIANQRCTFGHSISYGKRKFYFGENSSTSAFSGALQPQFAKLPPKASTSFLRIWASMGWSNKGILSTQRMEGRASKGWICFYRFSIMSGTQNITFDVLSANAFSKNFRRRRAPNKMDMTPGAGWSKKIKSTTISMCQGKKQTILKPGGNKTGANRKSHIAGQCIAAVITLCWKPVVPEV